jgi:DNA-binding NarL/FixJ family response regulator
MQAPAVLDLLTESERRVVLLVAEGLTNPQIAARLFVSPQTVKTHMKNVFRKLKVSSRTELTALVVREDGRGT